MHKKGAKLADIGRDLGHSILKAISFLAPYEQFHFSVQLWM
jgi:hypothetical protein